MPPAAASPDLRNYPERYHVTVRQCLRASLWAMGVTGLVALTLDLAAVFANGPLFLAALASAVFLVFGLLASVGAMIDCRTARVMPYFRRHVGEIDTFLAGEALARHLPFLDDLAARCDLPPLSAFGFADDLNGETLTWHNPSEGLRTVLRLRNSLQELPEDVLDHLAVLEDLQKLEQALQRAEAQDIPFCLLFRHGNTTSGHEWSVRQGTAF